MAKEVGAMRAFVHDTVSTLLAGPILVGAVLGQFSIEHAHAGAVSSLASRTSEGKASSEEGRKLYHGRGFCHQCHGFDGYIDRLPQMTPDTRKMIDQMDPKPADFRNPAILKSKNDQDRFNAIKNGHPGTAMFPHNYLKDSEIKDILAYLAVLRSEGQLQNRGHDKNSQ